MTLFLILINALGLALMHWDKRRAVCGQWRIPEAVLLTVAAAGGSVGILLGMYLFRHKTRKKRFSLGIPLLLAAQLALWLWYGA